MIRSPEAPSTEASSRSGPGPDRSHSAATAAAPAPPAPSADSRHLETLGDEIAELAAHIHAAKYRLLVRLREFDALFEESGGLWGFRSVAHWLSWRTSMSPLAAREKVRVARALGGLPLVSAAMEKGELSYSKVRALTRVEVRDPETEKEFMDIAREATAAQVENFVRSWRRLERPGEAGEAERARHRSRKLVLHPDEDGSWVVRGRLDPEVGALFEKALDLASGALYRREWKQEGHRERNQVRSRERNGDGNGERPAGSRAESGGGDPICPEREPLERRRADAVGLLAEAVLRQGLAPSRSAEKELTPNGTARDFGDGGGGGEPVSAGSAPEEPAAESTSLKDEPDGFNHEPPTPVGRADRFQVVLHVDLETLRDEDGGRGRSFLGDDLGVPAETGRRLSCDASRVVMVHDEGGHLLDVGRRSRTVPASIRRALDHRDRHCRFPACTSKFTDAHHIEHWAAGGETKLDNLVLLCRRHHRAVHEEGFTVEWTDESKIRFRRPGGAVIPEVPALPAVDGDPIEELRVAEREDGIQIDPWTTMQQWDHGPFDLDLALGYFLDGRGNRGTLHDRANDTAWDDRAWNDRAGGRGSHSRRWRNP